MDRWCVVLQVEIRIEDAAAVTGEDEELEEGEILSDDDEPTMELKYKYQEGTAVMCYGALAGL